MKQPSLPCRPGAELFGVYALGDRRVRGHRGQYPHLRAGPCGGRLLTFGLVIVVMVAGTGHLSGADLNPAVTLAFALTHHFPVRDGPALCSGPIGRRVGGGLTVVVGDNLTSLQSELYGLIKLTWHGFSQSH